jgi:hypothetical protein
MSKSSSRILALSFSLMLILVVFAMASGPITGVVDVPDAEAGTLDPALRTVVVAVNERAIPSQPNGPLRASLLAGRLPRAIQQATVLTDENCTPDAEGVSHCINVVQMGQQQISLRHNHKMSEVPCLSPGEEINVMPLALLNQGQ